MASLRVGAAGERPGVAATEPEERARQRRAWACAGAGAAWAVLFAPVLWRVSHGPATGFEFSDWVEHLRLVTLMDAWPPRIAIPHFLFHLPTSLVLLITPLSVQTAGVITTVVAVAATGATLTWFLQRPWRTDGARPGPVLAAGVAVAFGLAEFPQYLFFRATAQRGELLNVSLHQWNTPTTVTAEPLQILLFAAVATAFAERGADGRLVRWLPAITVVTALALPAVPLVLAAGVVPWLWQRSAPRWMWRRALRGLVIPVVVVSALQVAISVAWWDPEEPSSLALRLGGALALLDPWGPGLAVLLLPVLVLVVGGRDVRQHPMTGLLGWAWLAGLVAAASIVETGFRSTDGNVARAAYTGFWLVSLASVRWMVELVGARDQWSAWSRPRRVGVALLAAFAALALASGLGMYLEQVGLITFTGSRPA